MNTKLSFLVQGYARQRSENKERISFEICIIDSLKKVQLFAS